MEHFFNEWQTAIPAFFIPIGVLAAATYVRKQFHRVWSPAADVYVLLLTAEFGTMWEHKRFSASLWGVDVVQATLLLVVFTLILLLYSLFAEKDIIEFYAWSETEKELQKRNLPLGNPGPPYPSDKMIVLWIAGIALIAGQISLLLSHPDTPQKISVVTEQRQ